MTKINHTLANPAIGHRITFWNEGEGELRFITEIRPPGDLQTCWETVFGLAQDDKVDANGRFPALVRRQPDYRMAWLTSLRRCAITPPIISPSCRLQIELRPSFGRGMRV